MIGTLLSPSLLNPTLGQDGKPDAKTIQNVATEFESVFLSQMLEQMFSGESMGGYFGGGVAGDTYKTYMMDEFGKAMAKAGGIGIADQIKQELLKLQETEAL